jgi:predicted DNA-binding transcriptional regulator YafY
MGARDHYETITRVIQAFAGQRTWQQAELARAVGIQPRRLRTLLLGLSESGMPLEKEDEHPHVYWSVPPHWVPGGVIFDAEDWDVLVDAVLRIADPTRKERLLGRLLSGRRTISPAGGVERLNRAVAATPLTVEEHTMLLLVERSLLEAVPLEIHYYSASRGQLGWRVISPQKVIMEPRARLVAYCHTNRALRWFRLDSIQRGRLAPGQSRQDVPDGELEAFLATSVDGFRDGTEQELAFRVRSPEAAWVRGNLLPGMTIDNDAPGDELRVVARGAALVVARYIVGLGGAAAAEAEPLRSLVRQLAEAAIEGNR